jgi:hypothetical protein
MRRYPTSPTDHGLAQLVRNHDNLANLISRYAIVTVCVLVAAMIAPHLWHSWRDRRARKAPVSETARLNLPID